ncbi:hypothetical protein [Caldivirga sp.]|uniref:hypothetical protein n=1 Tax=Caldivirga sp. TaxID=2080243 RepID=UPI003D12A831
MPVLKPVKAIVNEAEAHLEDELRNLLANLVRRDGYWLLRSIDRRIGPSMINDGCPIASALRIRLNGLVLTRPSDVENIAFGNTVHEAYLKAVKAWNPGWRLEEARFEATVAWSGLQFTVGFQPDVLMSNGDEWYLIEVKSSRLRRSHEVQLALYWRLLKDEYGLKGAWLVTHDAVLHYNPRDLEPLAREGLGYLASVEAVLRTWSGDAPRLVIKGTCPCRFAPACPIWRAYMRRVLGLAPT